MTNSTEAPSGVEQESHARRWPEQAVSKPHHKLTPREIDVVIWLARGKSAAEVATLLNLSVCTVRAHIRNIIRKLNASNIAHSITRAFQAGILGDHIEL